MKQEGSKLDIGNICFTLAIGRDHYSRRIAIVADSVEKAVLYLEQLLEEKELSGRVIGDTEDTPLYLHGKRYCEGKEIELSLYPETSDLRRIPLPTYAFQKKRFWIESSTHYLGSFRLTYLDPKQYVAVKETEGEIIDPSKRLYAIFQRVMGIESIKESDNFFDLGGDSLLGVQLINEIHKHFHKKLSYHDLFDHPTIFDLKKLLDLKGEQTYQEIEASPFQTEYPLSFGQRRLWILHQMQEHPIAYNMYEAYEFNKLDLDSFQSALNELNRKHSAFRTSFIEREGVPYQRISGDHSFDLTTLDLKKEKDEAQKALDHMEAFRMIPFDLEKGPLAKALLIQISSEKYYFLFVMHHIISDGWSIRIIVQDLLREYQRNISVGVNSKESFNSSKIEYVDYVYWQQKSLSEERFQQLEDYWLKKLSGQLPICEIAGDKPRPPLFHFGGARSQFEIPKTVAMKLAKISAEQNATLFMILLTSVYVLIYRYSGQNDLLIGTPISGRMHRDLKEIVGFFVSTLAIRSSLESEERFLDALSKVRANVLEAFEHQDYLFDLLVDKLNLARDTSRSPIFNINVVLQNFELDEATRKIMSELHVKRKELSHDSCKWDLEFEFIKKDDGSIHCFLEYYKGIYTAEMIQILIENYLTLLDSIVQDPWKEIAKLQLRHLSLNIKGPDCKTVSVSTLHQAFEEQARLHSDLPAVKLGESRITYSSLNAQANQLARFLIDKRQLVRSLNEECVGILMENSVETIVSILAILKAGGAYVPLDVKAPFERLKAITTEGKIKTIISKKKHLSVLNSLLWSDAGERSFICLDTDSIFEEVEPNKGALMDENLWNQVALEGNDETTTSGWVSSYTGLPFSHKEMEEYKTNVYLKLQPFLKKESHLLEIGCGSGMTLFTLAPLVASYVGTDLSSAILEKNRARAAKEMVNNVSFHHTLAHQISTLSNLKSDLVILNSVIHCFPGLNYLRHVLKQAISLCKDQAALFLGDLMDQDLKEELEKSLVDFKNENREKGYRTKTDWSNELFVSRRFLEELKIEFPEIHRVETSIKNYSIENELTRFRYDAILHIDKKAPSKRAELKQKQQYDRSDIAALSDSNLKLDIPINSLAYVIFTSGSTGTPKGVMVEHRTVKRYIDWAIASYFEGGNELPQFPFYSPISFDLTVTSIFCPLLTGSYLRVFQGEFDEVLNQLNIYPDCNILKLTPTHLSMLIENGMALKSIHKFILGGEALYGSSVNQLFDLYNEPIQLFNEYGPTEATVGCVVYEIDKKLSEGCWQAPIGFPISHAKIDLLDINLNPVPKAGIGEIFIGGDCLARGYLNNPSLSDEKFIKDPYGVGRIYRTGDIGRWLPNGLLEYLGRKDRQVKVKGFRIELNEIESLLLKASDLDSVAVALKDDNRGNVICAYYSSAKILSGNDLRGFLSKALPEYMIPSYFIKLDRIPLSSNGKIDYLKLPNPFLNSQEEIIKPSNAIQMILVEAWSAVLGIPQDKISTRHDFFELGGDSIMAMRIFSKVKSKGIFLTIKEIFQFRTIESISRYLKGKKVEAACHISQDEIVGEIALTPIQKWFFEHEMPHPEYFSMIYLFKIPGDCDENLLRLAILKCLEHHDILRVVFEFENGKIKQCNLPHKDIAFYIEKFDLTLTSDNDQKKEIVRITEAIQGQFSLKEAPLLKAAVIDLGKNGKRLFIAIHHLIVDGVSWRYLVEDIELLYQTKLQASLPEKTSSYQDWAEMLLVAAEKKQFDIDYWLKIDPDKIPQLRTKQCRGNSIEESIETSMLLDPIKTNNVNELLLTALLYALRDVFNIDQLIINHEGYGRNNREGIDVSRTIGWFTTIYPLHLQLQKNLTDTLSYVKKILKSISEIDINYGIARYLQNHSHLKKFQPQVLFNYFGRVGADLIGEAALLKANAGEEIGRTSHIKNRLPHLLEINAISMENSLQISIVYHRESFSMEQIDLLKDSYRAFINKIINI